MSHRIIRPEAADGFNRGRLDPPVVPAGLCGQRECAEPRRLRDE